MHLRRQMRRSVEQGMLIRDVFFRQFSRRRLAMRLKPDASFLVKQKGSSVHAIENWPCIANKNFLASLAFLLTDESSESCRDAMYNLTASPCTLSSTSDPPQQKKLDNLGADDVIQLCGRREF